MAIDAWSALGLWAIMVFLTPLILVPLFVLLWFFNKALWIRLYLAACFLPLFLGVLALHSTFAKIEHTVAMMGSYNAEAIDVGTREARLPLKVGAATSFFFGLLGSIAETAWRRRNRRPKTTKTEHVTTSFPLWSTVVLLIAGALFFIATTREPISAEEFPQRMESAQPP